MEARASDPLPRAHGGPLDPDELNRAWRLLRSVASRLDRIAIQEGWPTPFGPVRYLILVLLERATACGLSARGIARALAMNPSALAHHLGVLEGAGLIRRAPWTLYDRRKVGVRLTDMGHYAVRRFGAAGPAPAIPARPSPSLDPRHAPM